MTHGRELDFADADEPVDEPGPEDSDRSRGVAVALGLVGGVLGLHRFYAGRTKSGVWMILTLGGLGVWWLYDVVLIVTGEFRDAEGRRIRHWEIPATGETSGALRGVEQLSGQVSRLERDVAELAERLDFAERLLAQQRSRDRMSPG